MKHTNLIKITSLTRSLLLVCHDVEDLRKHHYRSNASDLNYVPSNENGDCEIMKVLLNSTVLHATSNLIG